MDPEQPVIEARVVQSTNDMLIDEQEDDLELAELGLNHHPSFRNQQTVPLPVVAEQIGGASKSVENNIEKINNYEIISRLGSGAFAEVKKVKANEQFYAMKIYSLMKLKKQKFFACDHSFADYGEMFQNEIQILKRLKHQNVALCKEVLYGSNYAYVVMELCDLGQIMYFSESKNNFIRNQQVISYVKNKYDIRQNVLENITKIIFMQIALGLQYLHDHNISNRDIKVENLLCKSTNGHLNDIKIADFTTIRYSNDDISYFPCGTAGFQGPQIQNVSEGYSCKALDVWSFGVCLYTFYYQNFPFMAETEYLIEIRSANEQLECNENCPKWLREIVTKTTEKSYKKRLTIKEVVRIFRQNQ